MSQLYRLVYAIRCPFTEWRVPVGAILQTKNGLQIVEGELARDEGALGGKRWVFATEMSLETLRQSRIRIEDPYLSCIGPSFDVGKLHAVEDDRDLKKHVRGLLKVER